MTVQVTALCAQAKLLTRMRKTPQHALKGFAGW
jgi:hypothetical protein